jgi:beta-glucosidase
MTIDRSALSFYDEATGQWKAESGKFDALVGTSSAQLPARLTFELR